MTEGARKTRRRHGPDVIQHILEAALIEFSANGFVGAHIEAIARGADVTKQLVYYYFESKAALYEAVMQYSITEGFADILETDFAALFPRAAAKTFFEQCFDFYARTPALITLALDYNLHGESRRDLPRVRREVYGVYEAIMRRAIDERLIPADTDIATCFKFALMVVVGSFIGGDKPFGYGAPEQDPVERAQAQRGKVIDAVLAILGLRVWPDGRHTDRLGNSP
ncbi:TetR/AcrR family transcriptional regulator [Sphingomonas crocodyli]|nr:TetR/AcrR family transcriptional regulator [Sphingomonas crocodyli]